jgi:hypothetical protein
MHSKSIGILLKINFDVLCAAWSYFRCFTLKPDPDVHDTNICHGFQGATVSVLFLAFVNFMTMLQPTLYGPYTVH